MSSPWFPFNSAPFTENVRLFCFPYGGGNAAIYQSWQQYLPEKIKVSPVQLPGRGVRIQEPSYQRIMPLIEELTIAIQPYLDRPFIFFGHSMGALLSFELACYLREKNQPLPKHLLVSGYRAPHLPDPNSPIHHLPDPDFIREIAKLNGTPSEILAHPGYLEVFLPALRADFRLCETYQYRQRDPLTCPITAIGGNEDPEVSKEMLLEWEKHTTNRFSLWMFAGDHFFIHSEEEVLVKKIGKLLNSSVLQNS